MTQKLARLALLAAGAIFAAAQTDPVMAVTGGRIRGRMTSGGGAAFKAIPYSRPPLGDLRWRDPQPVEPWEGVRAMPASSPLPARSIPKAGTRATSQAAATTVCI
jgi:para-nitrobenzyl esterase